MPNLYPNTLSVDGAQLAIGWPDKSFNALVPLSAQGCCTLWTYGSGDSTSGLITLPGGNVDGTFFGFAVAMLNNVLVIGAPQLGGGSMSQGTGVAYVYTYSLGAWTLQATLHSSGEAVGDEFGYAVGFDGNANILIGAPQTTTGNGKVCVFQFSGGTWSQTQTLSAGDAAAAAQFGASIAIDGTTAAIGAPGASSGAGEAYVFTRSGGTWSQAHALSQPHGGDTNFGFSVCLTSSYLFVGSPGDGSSVQGAVEIYPTSTFSGPTRISPGAAGDYFGFNIAADAAYLFIGAPTSEAGAGSVWYYSLVSAVWTEQQQIAASSGAPLLMGTTVGWDGSNLYASVPESVV